MLTIYGIPKSRAFRCIWAAEEAGLPYRVEPVRPGTDSREPGFIAINPNGKVPVLRDGDLVLFESLAICLHIASRAGAPLMPTGDDAARVLQWTLWVATEVEHHIIRWAYNTYIRPPEQRVTADAEAGKESALKALAVLDTYLAGREWLVGGAFSAADLSVAGVLYASYANGFALAPVPRVEAWLKRCLARDAARKAIAIREGQAG